MIVLDTTVVSYIFNGDDRARFYQQRFLGRPLFISFQTLEEQWSGAYQNRWGSGLINDLLRHLEEYEVVWPDTDLVYKSAFLRAERIKAGRELSPQDAWIAATALYLGCPLFSHDGDFEGIPNLELIRNPSP